MRQHDETREDRIESLAEALRRANHARDHAPVWEDEGGAIDLCVHIGRETLHRSPEIEACYEALQTALSCGRDPMMAIERAALYLQDTSVDLAATVAAAAAQRLDVERLYAGAVWTGSIGYGLLSSQGEEITLTEPHTPKPPKPTLSATPESQQPSRQARREVAR